MGAGTAQGGACLLISGKVRKNMEFVVFAGVLLLLFIFMIVQELKKKKKADTDEKSGKTFQEVSS